MSKNILKQSWRCYFAMAKVTPGLHKWTFIQLGLLLLTRIATAALAYALSLFVNKQMDVTLWQSALVGVIAFFCISKFFEWFVSGVHGRIHSSVILPAGLTFIDLSIFKMLKNYHHLADGKSPVEMASMLNKKMESRNFLGFLFNHILGPVVELLVCAALLANLGFAWLGWLLIPVCMIHLFISIYLIPKIKNKLTTLLSISAKSVSTFSSSLEKANLAQVFGSTELLVSHLEKITKEETNQLKRLYVLNDFMAVAVNFPLAVFACLFFYFGSVRVEEGLATYGGFAALMGIVTTTFSQLKNLTFAFDGLNSSLAALEPHLDLIENDKPSETPKIVFKKPPSLVFNSYSVSIDSRKLFEVSLDLKPGQKLYVVGESGTGKTSMIKGLLGYQVFAGNLRAGDVDLRIVDRLFSWMPQDTSSLEGTVALNLRIGKPKATEQEMIDVLKKVNLWSKIQEIGGLESSLNYQGGNFSGGENQRLSLARALLSDNPILLLDEPSSALDLTLEKEVFSHIENSPKSAIIVLHRLKAIPQNAMVLFLQKNKPFQLGKLKELLDSSNEFAKFYNVGDETNTEK